MSSIRAFGIRKNEKARFERATKNPLKVAGPLGAKSVTYRNGILWVNIGIYADSRQMIIFSACVASARREFPASIGAIGHHLQEGCHVPAIPRCRPCEKTSDS